MLLWKFVQKIAVSKTAIEWTVQHQLILNEVLDILKSQKLISFPDFEKSFIVYCDASETGLGVVLCQNQDGKLKVISYASRTLTPAEKNYQLDSGKLKFLALKWAITDRFCDYFMYVSLFDVYIDNNPFTYVLATAKLNATGLR